MSDKILAYIVMERGLKYNDSTYDSEEGGEPRKAYIDKALAEKEAKDRDVDSLRVFSNLYYLDAYVSNEELVAKLKKYSKNPLNVSETCLDCETTHLTDEQLRDILDSLDFNFNYVQAVELE